MKGKPAAKAEFQCRLFDFSITHLRKLPAAEPYQSWQKTSGGAENHRCVNDQHKNPVEKAKPLFRG